MHVVQENQEFRIELPQWMMLRESINEFTGIDMLNTLTCFAIISRILLCLMASSSGSFFQGETDVEGKTRQDGH